MIKKILAVLMVASILSPQSLYAMLAEGRTGPSVLGDGSVKEMRLSRDGTSVIQAGHAPYQEAIARGNAYYCADLGGTSVTTQAGLSAVTPALALYNPINSGKNLVLIETGIDITAAPAAAAGFIIAVSSAGTAGGPQVTTAGTMQNALLGSLNASVGQCYRVATLTGAPIAVRYIGGTTGAAAISGYSLIDNTDGKIIVSPGTAISIQTTSAAAIIAHFLFEEIPL